MKTFRRLITMIAPAWRWMLAASLLALLTIAANVGLMAAAAFLIAAAALHPPLAALSPSIVGVRFFGLARAVFRYLERYVAHDATFRLLSRVRVWCYQALEPLVPAGLAEFRGGDLFSRIVNDVETLQYFYLRALLPPTVALLALIGMAGFLWGFGAAFVGLLAAGFLCGGVVLPVCLGLAGRNVGCRLLEARARLSVVFADALQGLRDLAAAPPEASRQAGQAASADASFRRWQGRSAFLAGIADAAGNLIMNLTMAAAVIVAVPMIKSGALDGVYLAALALGIQSAFEAVLPLGSAYRYWEESFSAAGRLFVLLDRKPAILETGTATTPSGVTDLEVRNLRFCYHRQGPPVLDDVSFRLPAGGRLAVVGPSGAGKSTLVSLLLRFWDYETGCIRLGGRDIKEYDTRSLRDLIGVARQQDYVFAASLGDNIRLARPEAAGPQVVAAAEKAALGDVIRSLPRGLDTPVGGNGYGLSGGERRRLAIARLFLKDPPILIFDEPTAGLDAVTERIVLDAIGRITPGKTTILITHRLVGLENMDEILVLDRGQVAERGRQSELLAKKGLFYAMWCLQNDFFATPEITG
ncbi:MAG: thiol reductant ABC exporter subunit CydC [Negativicutes bacterium]|nr:thiol reductant ABC exporter subunit CydC [Negativicutes bacterium]